IVDQKGGIHSLARRIDGMKAAGLREFMAAVDRDSLPSIAEARDLTEEGKRRAQLSHDALEKGYAKGEGYAIQSSAAQKDFERRQKALNGQSDTPLPRG